MERIVPLNGPRPSPNVLSATPKTPDVPTNRDDGSSEADAVAMTTTIGVHSDQEEDERLTEGATTTTGYIRSDSVMVSEWGLEHTLKLRDEGKPNDAPLLEEVLVKKTTPPTHIAVEKPNDAAAGEEEEEEGDLPLPSTPVIATKPAHKTDWWSKALAESGGVVDDYDSLIETLESKEPRNVSDQLTTALHQ